MKILIKILTCLFIISLSFHSCSEDETLQNSVTPPVNQTYGSIYGKVTDKLSGYVIANAIITTTPATSSVTTDAQGNYILQNITTGNYSVNASKSGYNSNSINNISVTTNDTTTANMSLVYTTPTTGLVVYYPFNGNEIDESGNGNNLTKFGLSLTSDRFGNVNKAYLFSNNGYMEKDSANNLPMGNSPKTISCWIKTNTSSRTMVLTEWGTHSLSQRFSLMTYVSNSCEFFSGFANDVQGNILVTDNTWKFIVVTYENGVLKLYVNGNQDRNISIPALNTFRNRLRLGKSVIDTEIYSGVLDDVRIYNRALSQTEIQQLFHEGGW